ncbi:MAG: hypothetical protein HZC24_08400, partial [Rhodocyclales bacterium]|nr:hypothetical protein [Rhodocyclales bacterium]
SGIAAVVCLLAIDPSIAQTATAKTNAGHEFGVLVSSVKYSEPSLMSIKSTKLGIDYAGTFVDAGGWYLRPEARFESGKGTYTSSTTGSMSGRPDWYYEARGLAGKDIAFNGDVLSVYAGLGYRYAFSDVRGLSSTGNPGYRRESSYLSLPIGLTHQTRLSNRAKLLSTIEFSHLLRGQQDSKLSDTVGYNGITAAQDVRNIQRRGYGLRFSVTYQIDRWSIRPYVDYWNVKDSDSVSAATTTTATGTTTALVKEPANNTKAFGVRVAYRF